MTASCYRHVIFSTMYIPFSFHKMKKSQCLLLLRSRFLKKPRTKYIWVHRLEYAWFTQGVFWYHGTELYRLLKGLQVCVGTLCLWSSCSKFYPGWKLILAFSILITALRTGIIKVYWLISHHDLPVILVPPHYTFMKQRYCVCRLHSNDSQKANATLKSFIGFWDFWG